MSGGAVAALVLGGLVVVGGGIALYVHHGRVVYRAPMTTLPAARVSYGQQAALAGPSVTSQVLGSVTSMADAYLSSDAGSNQVADFLSSL
jgi:hypothetical protein